MSICTHETNNYKYTQIFLPEKTVCFCCLAEHVTFVRLQKCKHKQFLLELLKNKVDFKQHVICFTCHHFLRKIEKFRQLIQSSVLSFKRGSAVSSTQRQNSKHTMHPQLTKTIINMVSVMTVSETLSTHTDTTQNPLEVNDVKNENEFSFPEDSVDIKDEQSGDIKDEQSGDDDDDDDGCDGLKSYERKEEGTSETESEKELAEFIKSPEKPRVLSALSPFDGKINIVWLKPDQLLAEREMLKRKPLYTYKGFKCEYCIKGFLFKRVLENHMKRHDPKHGKVVCMICNSYLKTELILKSHYRRHFMRYECMLCSQRFMSELCCVEHYNKNHGETHGVIDYGYNCNKCNYITNSYRSLKRHRNCHKDTWQQCKICFRGFRSSSSYNNHVDLYHSTEKPVYECNMCKKVYNFLHSLRYHMLTKHENSGETFACVDCKKVFASHRCLVSHLKTHKRHAVKGEPKLICDDCGLKFHDKQQIIRHIYMKHMQINRCRYCSKVFSLPKCLKIHIESVHFRKEASRDKICQYCGKAFTTKNILEAHIRTHTLERPLKCPHCPATFSHSAARYNHKKLVHDPNRMRKPRNRGVE